MYMNVLHICIYCFFFGKKLYKKLENEKNFLILYIIRLNLIKKKKVI